MHGLDKERIDANAAQTDTSSSQTKKPKKPGATSINNTIAIQTAATLQA